ncbi:ATPase component of various ABC-type transport systems with duplicated ATPase domain protein [Mycobacteroides abscessus MAB_030201_1075]|uniref:ATPase component of various ABC-type transport systems with duplicated ATPase domain protein n=1 Tax=Mycobacteroides abscessus MAB_030201_1075 TaxID=1335410 RepID=A0A829PNV3_9MYCO|nr:ATPase component of various ABC-type transport systems with duplicated ATPase domain protein [Mycobacteroides abscessus MAB_030201_1075]
MNFARVPLKPDELAQAAVMAALTAAMVIVGIALPILGAVQLLGAVPMGLLGYRYRIRVLLAAAVAGESSRSCWPVSADSSPCASASISEA